MAKDSRSFEVVAFLASWGELILARDCVTFTRVVQVCMRSVHVTRVLWHCLSCYY